MVRRRSRPRCWCCALSETWDSLSLVPPRPGRQQMTSRHKLLGESPSRYPISAQDTHARTHTQEQALGGSMRRWGWQAAAGWIFWFTGLEPAGSDRLDRVVLQQGLSNRVQDGVSLGAPALDCVDVCAKEGDGLAGRRRF